MPNRCRLYWLLLAELAYSYNPDQGTPRSSLAARRIGLILRSNSVCGTAHPNQITKNTIASCLFRAQATPERLLAPDAAGGLSRCGPALFPSPSRSPVSISLQYLASRNLPGPVPIYQNLNIRLRSGCQENIPEIVIESVNCMIILLQLKNID